MATYLAAFLVILACNTLNNQERFYISFERSGGFSGIANTIIIDGNTLEIEEKQNLLKMIDDADFFKLKTNEIDTLSAPDQFSYKITIGIDHKEKTIHLSDPAVPDSLRPLINYLSRKARANRL